MRLHCPCRRGPPQPDWYSGKVDLDVRSWCLLHPDSILNCLGDYNPCYDIHVIQAGYVYH